MIDWKTIIWIVISLGTLLIMYLNNVLNKDFILWRKEHMRKQELIKKAEQLEKERDAYHKLFSKYSRSSDAAESVVRTQKMYIKILEERLDALGDNEPRMNDDIYKIMDPPKDENI